MRQGLLPLQAPLGFLQQASVFDGNGRLGGERAEEDELVWVEGLGVPSGSGEDSHGRLADQYGDGCFGTDPILVAPVLVQESRVGPRRTRCQGLSAFEGQPLHPFSGPKDLPMICHQIRIARRGREVEHLRGLVPEPEPSDLDAEETDCCAYHKV